MGLLSIIKKQKLKDNEIRVLTLGLDNAGKTTIVKQLLGENVDDISPTMGFQISNLSYKDYNLNVWDIGGQKTLRTFWANYFDKTNVVLWVVDALSSERLLESSAELREKILLQDRLDDVFLAVIVNKTDLVQPEALRSLSSHISRTLDLPSHLASPDSWAVFLASGKTGHGLPKVLDWIVSRNF